MNERKSIHTVAPEDVLWVHVTTMYTIIRPGRTIRHVFAAFWSDLDPDPVFPSSCLVLWSWYLRRKKLTSRFDLKSHPIFSGPYSVNLRPDSQHWSLQRFKHVCIPRRRIIPWVIAGLRYEVLCEDQPVAAADLCYVSHQPAHYLPGLGKGMVPWPREEDKPTKVHFASAIFFICFGHENIRKTIQKSWIL